MFLLPNRISPGREQALEIPLPTMMLQINPRYLGGVEPPVTIGDSAPSSVPLKDNDLGVDNQAGVIESTSILGDFDRSARGIDYFRDITISLVGDNLNDDNFLSPEGLHWSSHSRVELIKGRELGDFDFSVFPRDVPKARVKAFRINDGDSGRITYVGRTRSGIDLDLIWTVTGSDKEDWAAHSGYANSKVKGLGFTGEQFFQVLAETLLRFCMIMPVIWVCVTGL